MTEIFKDVIAHIPFTTEDVNDSVFSVNIKNYINASLAELNQNGIGVPIDVFDETPPTWDVFFTGQTLCTTGMPLAKQFVYTQVQILFDTPQPGTLKLLQDKATEFMWRARLEFDSDIWKPIDITSTTSQVL